MTLIAYGVKKNNVLQSPKLNSCVSISSIGPIMSEFQEYPKMLYRPGNEKSHEIWEHRLDTLTVNSFKQEFHAVKDGWHIDINKAIKLCIRKQKLLLLWQFYLRNWQWLWGSLLAIILAVFFGG